jgi:DNA-binding SARP family transcriptional activator
MPRTLNHLKSRALLYYLAATGKPQPRAHLAALLWGESGQREAYHSLRSSLYHLRKALQALGADQVLVSDGELLSLAPTFYECDVLEFRLLLAQDNETGLSQAVELYGGPLLQGFTIPDAPMFDDWVQTESTRLNQACFAALERLALWAEARAAWSEAIGFAQKMIQIDPLAEAVQQRLMRLYVRQGEVALALRQYLQFENQLQQELGIRPAPETQALHADILRQQRDHAAHTTLPARRSPRQPNILPFAGRDELLHQLLTIAAQAQGRQGTTVLIQGEGGIGKSRLLDEFASQLIDRSPAWMILQGACSPFDDLLSHGPFLEALQDVTIEDLNDLLHESDASVPDARGRFFWRVLQTIRSLTHSVPLLLVIEDLQWANSSTLNLFGFLSMRLHHLPVMLVGTVQHAEAIPALQRLITLGRRRHELHLLSLAPLPLEAIEDLLHSSRVNPITVETLTEWLHEKSGGNPFLLSEILAQLRTEAILQPMADGWQLDATRWLRWKAKFMLPETTHDLVGWRLADVSPEARNLLDVLAVAAQPVPESILREIPAIWTDSVPALVDDMVARGLLLEIPDRAMLALPHHLLRETLLHRLSNLRRRLIHRQLAEALEMQRPEEDNPWLRQIALHAVAGEDIPRARRYGIRLLPALPHEYAGVETVDFVQHLHDLLAPSASAQEMVRMTRALGILHQSLGHLDVAMQWHQQNLHWAERLGDVASQAEAHFEMGELALMSIDYQTAAHAAQVGLTKISLSGAGEPAFAVQSLTGRGYRLLGAALAMEGRDLAAAEDHLQKAVAIQRQMENQADLCAVLFELGNVAAQRGELPRALDFYEESARVAEAGRIHYYLALARNNFAYHSLLLGNLEAARQSAAQGIKIAEAYDLLAARLHLYSTKGEIYLALHEWREAEESFHSGLALAEELGSLERQAGYRGGLALVARGRKDLEEARRLLEEALALIADQGYWHLRTRLQLWLAETLFDQAQYEQAGKLLEEALEVARAQQRTLLVELGERLLAQLLAIDTIVPKDPERP